MKITIENTAFESGVNDTLEQLMLCAIEVSANAKVPVSFKFDKYEVFVNAGIRTDRCEAGTP
jgi:hypothetical protein